MEKFVRMAWDEFAIPAAIIATRKQQCCIRAETNFRHSDGGTVAFFATRRDIISICR